MRLLIDTMIALLLVGVLAGLLLHHRDQQGEMLQVQVVHDALTALYEESLYHGTDPDSLTAAGFPKTISASWFKGKVPMNVTAPASQPWLDVAPMGDNADHPPDPVIISPTQAGFWYNPQRGIFRARVVPQFSEQETVEYYNRLNNTAVKTLLRDHAPKRRPISLADSQHRRSVVDQVTDPRTLGTSRRPAISDATAPDDTDTTLPTLRRPSLSDVKVKR